VDRAALVAEPDAETASARTSTFKSGRRPGIELITRAEPRRRWSVEQKQSIAAESLAPGASPTEVARRHGISSGLLYAWRKALLAAQPRSRRGRAQCEASQPSTERSIAAAARASSRHDRDCSAEPYDHQSGCQLLPETINEKSEVRLKINHERGEQR
jgi:transposase-like protein